jgi:hypothetical protein
LEDAADWFRFETTTVGTSGHYVQIDFQGSRGDLGLQLLDANGVALVTQNASSTDTEKISLSARGAGVYFVRVFGRSGAANAAYSLTINPPSTGAALSVTIAPSSFSEAAGADAASGTVERTGDLSGSLLVHLVSSDITEAKTPPEVTILAGAATAAFGVDAVDDTQADGSQTVYVTAWASGYASGFVRLTVTDEEEANQRPTISDLADQSTTPNTAIGPIAFTVGDAETAVDSLVISTSSSNTSLVDNAAVVLGGSGTNRTLTITPSLDQIGTTTITVTVRDADGAEAHDQFVLTVAPDITAPAIAVTTPIMGDDRVDAAEVAAVAVAGTRAEPNRTVSITFTDVDSVAVTKNVMADEIGNWTLAGGNEVDLGVFSDGAVTVTATSTDLAGNTGTAQVTITKDVAGPRVAQLSPAPSTTVTGVIQIDATFDRAVNPNTLTPAAVVLMRSGGDGTFADGNEVSVAVGVRYASDTHRATVVPRAPLSADLYRLTVGDSVRGTNGADLDGEFPDAGTAADFPSGDGQPGGSFATTFRINASGDLVNFVVPYDGTLFVQGLGGGGVATEFGLGISLATWSAVLRGLPQVTQEVPVGTVRAGDVLHFALKSDSPTGPVYAFSSASDAAAREVFTDRDGNLGGGGSIMEATGPGAWLLRCDDAASFDDDDSDILLQLRLDAQVYAQGPRVTGMTPAPEATVGSGVNAVHISFDRPLEQATLWAPSFRVLASGGDGGFTDGNETLVAIDDVSWNTVAQRATLTLANPLPRDRYQVTVFGNLRDLDGAPLDGEFSGTFPSGDGAPGGDFVAAFAVANTPPAAERDRVATLEGIAIPLLLTGHDADGDALTFRITAGPFHGTLTPGADTAHWTYTPQTGYRGQDSLTFVANDGRADSSAAILGIEIAAADSDLEPISLAVTSPARFQMGETIRVAWGGRNNGPGETHSGWWGDWQDRLYLSPDEQLDTGDVLLGAWTSYASPVPSGGAYEATLDVVLPSDRPRSGRYYLIVALNTNRGQTETNRTNNTLAVPITLDPFIRLTSPWDQRFADPTTPLEVAWHDVHQGRTVQVALAVDSDADPTNQSGEQWLGSPLAETGDGGTNSTSLRLLDLAARAEPYYVWARMTDGDGEYYSPAVPIRVFEKAYFSRNANHALGGSSYQVYGLEAGVNGTRVDFRVLTNFAAETNGGDLYINVGGRWQEGTGTTHGIAVDANTPYRDSLEPGDLYTDARFRTGVVVGNRPTFITGWSGRVSGRSSAIVSSRAGLPTTYVIEGSFDTSDLPGYHGQSIQLAWSPYCGNDNADLIIQGTRGLTIITHGFQLQGDHPTWLDSIADQIIMKAGHGQRVNLTFDDGEFTPNPLPALLTDGVNDVIVVAYDWASKSNNTVVVAGDAEPGWREAAGDFLANWLLSNNLVQEANAANIPIHFIAHSYGAVVISEAIRRLGFYGITVDQMTTLDPHDQQQDGIPDAIADPSVTVWANVKFADNYWEDNVGQPDNRYDNDFLSKLLPVGHEILRAANRDLTAATAPHPRPVELAWTPHSRIHSWYYKTINGIEEPGGDAELLGRDWYPNGTPQDHGFVLTDASQRDPVNLARLGMNSPTGLRSAPLPVLSLQDTVFNGDFRFAVPDWQSNDLPGYDDDDQYHYHLDDTGDPPHGFAAELIPPDLNAPIPSVPGFKHRPIYLPPSVTALRFEYSVQTAGVGDLLRVQFEGQATPSYSHDLSQEVSGWQTAYVPIPRELLGTAIAFTIEVRDANPLFPMNSEVWVDNIVLIDSSAPTASIAPVTPDPRKTNVGTVTVNFSEAVSGVDPVDFRLTRNGTPVDLADLTITGSGASYTLNLAGRTEAEGAYLLTLTAAGSGIQDVTGNPFAEDATDFWLIDNTAPTAPGITAIASDTGTAGMDGITRDAALLLTGTAEPYSTVTVFRGGMYLGTAAVDAAGAWSFDYMATTLADGNYQFRARVTDGAGNASGDSTTFPVTVDTVIPEITVTGLTIQDSRFILTGQVNDPTPSSGLSELTLLVNGQTLTAAVAGGVWDAEVGSVTPDGIYAITATATDRAGNTATTSNELRVELDHDGDGVADLVEGAAPNGGDGNHDGTADGQQGNVASFPSADNGKYLTLAAGAGTSLVDVRGVPNPSSGDTPQVAQFPVGFLEFTVISLPSTGTTVVTLFVEPGTNVNTYYKYGPTRDVTNPHWYPFMFDGLTGAVVFGERIEVSFRDGQRGDDDLRENGQIHDVGAPGVARMAWQNPAVQYDVDNSGLVAALDVLILINEINSRGSRDLLDPPQGSDRLPPYLDVDGNGRVEPADVVNVINYINLFPATMGEAEEVAPRALSETVEQPSARHGVTAIIVGRGPVLQPRAASDNASPWSRRDGPIWITALDSGELGDRESGIAVTVHLSTLASPAGPAKLERRGPRPQRRTTERLDMVFSGLEAILEEIAEDVACGREGDIGHW